MKIALLSITSFLGIILFSQEKLDGIAVVINDEIVIQSELKQMYESAKQENSLETLSECSLLEEIMKEKLLIAEAKRDTLITVNQRALTEQVNEQVERTFSQYGEEQSLKAYGFSTVQELKQAMLDRYTEQSYSQQISRKITDGIDASPVEVNQFYKEYQAELPAVEEEIELSHIVFYPTPTDAHTQQLKDRLLEIKHEVESGASFSTQAVIHSEGPSAVDGGLITGVRRGMMAKEFEAVIYNLEENEVSDPFETEFGWHIAQLVKRRGETLDVRHILLKVKPSEEELDSVKRLAIRIKKQLDEGTSTFEEAVRNFSEDPSTRLSKGLIIDPTTETSKMVRAQLPTTLYLEVTGLSVGAVTDPFKDELGQDSRNKKQAYRIVKVNAVIPKHEMNLQDDYEKIKLFTANSKKSKAINKWVTEHIQDNFIKIDTDYQTCSFESNWLKK